MSQRIPAFVTGVGLESPIGRDRDDFWLNLSEGHSGIRPIRAFDASDLPCQVAGEVDFQADEFLTNTEVRRTSRFQQLLFAACLKAISDASLPLTERVALVCGTGGAGLPIMEDGLAHYFERGWSGIDRLILLKTLPNMAASFAAQKLHLTGPCLTISTACASGCDAIGLALRLIRSGDVDAAIACGVDAWITRSSIAAFSKLHALSKRAPSEAQRASRPFDRDRDGMVPAEGSGAIVLESPEAVRRRGVSPRVAVFGAASNCDASHPTAPRDDGLLAGAVIERAVRDGGIAPSTIDHVNAHGTSTRLNDAIETRAIKAGLGGRAYAIPITANKSVLGHASGASGIIEAIATVVSLEKQYVPPTMNLDNPDPECDLDYTPNVGRRASLEFAVKASFGFGGQNSAILVGLTDREF